MITSPRALLLPLLAIALAACGSDAKPSGNDSESFAARLKAGEATPPANPASVPDPAATATPQIAQTLPGAAPGAFARGTLTDPASAKCGAPLMAPFMGKLADQPTRAAIAQTLGRTDRLRFVAFGSEANVNPDPTNPRLSLMLDAQGIIRDARCG